MKIGLIVEGDSDKAFFDDYFMKNFSFDKRNLLVLTSGKKKGQCEIENKQIIHAHIETLIGKKCKHIFILVDLNTQSKEQKKYECVILLKNDYAKNVNLKKFEDKFSSLKVIVISQEIESWLYSAWDFSDNKMKKDLNLLFKNIEESKKKRYTSLNEKDLLKKFISYKKPLDLRKNQSLKYFMDKLEQCK